MLEENAVFWVMLKVFRNPLNLPSRQGRQAAARYVTRLHAVLINDPGTEGPTLLGFVRTVTVIDTLFYVRRVSSVV